MNITVSEAMAAFFMEQCMGSHNGHMSAIPNNPVLSGICKAHSVHNQEAFVIFLRQVADQLEETKP